LFPDPFPHLLTKEAQMPDFSDAETHAVEALCRAAEDNAPAAVATCRRLLDEVPIERWSPVLERAVNETALRAGDGSRASRLRALGVVMGQLAEGAEA
jgi:hypothetical protein